MEPDSRSTHPPDSSLVPPESAGIPGEMRQDHEGPIQWWRPDWRDVYRSGGRRWLLVIPLFLLLVLGIAALVGLGFHGHLFGFGFKAVLLAVGGVISLTGYGIRRAAQARKEPFCIFCGYNLTGLPDRHRCPECGRAYTWRMIEEYRRDPQFFIERWKAGRKLPSTDTPFDAGPVRRRRRARDGTE